VLLAKACNLGLPRTPQTRQAVAEQRILLIEDEATTREIMTELLRGQAYAIDSVATAGAAATCLQTIPYSLVIADWVLPDGDGIDVADSAAHRGARTLVITGHMVTFPICRKEWPSGIAHYRSRWITSRS